MCLWAQWAVISNVQEDKIVPTKTRMTVYTPGTIETQHAMLPFDQSMSEFDLVKHWKSDSFGNTAS